ncbi:2,3-diketo-5-methylthiopentyl-1-phosphate enolase [Alkalicoccobacillus porphyridii]|uniref:2,3-diketo-5-methylthiopentyl-1-phosphate enolase n=1 Tax=Alkalicoccobacillus porphyridii TaxID=2597270 RepID=A0A553ZXL5_9BACI|nr:2,3-diketo-5-methylthiopentyl-1-phosphate enolase [Alkalicoccobacillus porphyridii]TSB46184.1 2,3-diketo-5-methylthiopentyl-1-phosphate enolase [Alkalicoccobacillus porphyridii]
MSIVTATYRVYDPKKDLHKKAESIALGLTIGSWTHLPTLEKKQLEKHKGEVVEVVEEKASDEATRVFGEERTTGLIKIAYPQANFSADIPAILTTIFGKLSLDGEIKLVDVDFEPTLEAAFPGPQVGIESIRSHLSVYDRPLVMSIFKGMIGKDLSEFKQQLLDQLIGGVDIVKDDEILFDNPLTPFTDRVKTGADVLTKVYEQTGERKLYAVNLTGRTFELKEKAKHAVELGASALLFNVFAYGLDVLQALAEDPEINVPIMAHPAVSGALTASPYYGISNKVLLGKLLRLAGADLVLFPSPYGSVAMEKSETLDIADALREKRSINTAFPVPSAGIHPGLTPWLIEDFGIDSVINAGGGIHGHPGGAKAGAKAFRDAVSGVLASKTLAEAAAESPELATALELWGSPK